MVIVNNHKTYSWIALILVFLGDVFVVAGLHDAWSVWQPWILCTLCLLLLLWVISWLNKIRFGMRRLVLAKLLSNAIGPHMLGTLYLLFFVAHLGLMGNAFMYLFASDSLVGASYPFVTCLTAIATLILFYPDGRPIQKDSNAKMILISGISEIKIPHTKQYKDLNLRPLVRILQEKDIKNCELLILRSDYNHIPDSELQKNINQVLTFVLEQEKLEKGTDESEIENSEEKVKRLLDGKSSKEQLGVLIRRVAQIEFPDKADEIEDLKIDWTNPCDYNEFVPCYNELNEKIKEKDNPQHCLMFYISPGTALLASLLTLLAIDGDRELVYYSQEKGRNDANRLVRIPKESIPFKNLLSQALENI